MGKIFSSILRDRISDWAEANGILNESQFRFRVKRRTTDAIFILHTITQIFQKKRENPFIHASLTCVKLLTTYIMVYFGRNWPLWAYALRYLPYCKTCMHRHLPEYDCVNHEESETFTCRRGIRQGCNLSHLFSLFINDLDQFLTDNNSGSIELVQTQ